MLSRLPDDFTALVTGASGGIGSAVLDALLDSERPGRVIAVSRQNMNRQDARLETLKLDLTQSQDLQRLTEHLNGEPVHLIFNAIGILHADADNLAPEKRLEDLDPDALARVFHINAATAALLLKALLPCLKGDHPTIFASLSARVGSIEDNRLGGWYAYRASKAAHNMLLRTAAIELRRLNNQATVLCLHPGTTDTALSAPFQGRVPEGKLFTPAFVAERLLDVMEQRTPQDTGSFWDWEGKSIPW
ncbi:SDR family NAD(P)-dependent oxidoreductase [Pistricoccus aurantiacus]|uniref:SDR family NAD(P)-dependent oxidoreductase n=1 Tax=Pistricoccus aurantiacus TaxID=1883414 RepID=A0A5B8SWU7_9GAMM|nr:SDR family NAD(P)-dependent oxidoreductase [Pistricoccus aurantiacus]QEA39393.1 SDR family NAD(P)-dependent oxidoreductase [Pistricoccus aurantiacus]